VEDANIIRAMPNMTVLNPCDAVETAKMVSAMIRYRGPVYIRINRNDLPVFTSPEGEYRIGKIYPVWDSSEGPAAEVCVFATGVMVSKSVEAGELLKKEGITVEVVNVSTLKPLLRDEVMKFARGRKAVITAEEAVRTGGLGQAIGSILLEGFGASGEAAVPFHQIAIDDIFGVSARDYDELLEKYGLGAGDVYTAVKQALKK
jgi:transketolase